MHLFLFTMRKKYLLIIGGIAFFLCLGFFVFFNSKSAIVNVQCDNVENFKSTLGYINSRPVSIGDVFIVDSLKKQMAYVAHINIDDNSIFSDKKLRKNNDSMLVSTASKFTVKFDESLQKNSKLKGAVEDAIKNYTTFYLGNSYEEKIIDPVTFLNHANTFASIVKTYKKCKQFNPNCKIMLVTNMIYAERLELRLSQRQQQNAKLNIVSVGNLNVNVCYDCNGDFKKYSECAKGVFYAPNYYDYSDRDKFYLSPTRIDLGTYTACSEVSEFFNTIDYEKGSTSRHAGINSLSREDSKISEYNFKIHKIIHNTWVGDLKPQQYDTLPQFDKYYRDSMSHLDSSSASIHSGNVLSESDDSDLLPQAPVLDTSIVSVELRIRQLLRADSEHKSAHKILGIDSSSLEENKAKSTSNVRKIQLIPLGKEKKTNKHFYSLYTTGSTWCLFIDPKGTKTVTVEVADSNANIVYIDQKKFHRDNMAILNLKSISPGRYYLKLYFRKYTRYFLFDY